MTERDRTPDDAAWLHSVVQQYENGLVRYAARLLGDVERARDVAQDTFLRLCREPRAEGKGGKRRPSVAFSRLPEPSRGRAEEGESHEGTQR